MWFLSDRGIPESILKEGHLKPFPDAVHP